MIGRFVYAFSPDATQQTSALASQLLKRLPNAFHEKLLTEMNPISDVWRCKIKRCCQMTSAKVRSVFRKYHIPETSRIATIITEIQQAGQ
jgi:hypothetical protein